MFLLGVLVIVIFLPTITLFLFGIFENDVEVLGGGATALAEANKEPKPTEQQVIITLTPEEYNALIQENSKE